MKFSVITPTYNRPALLLRAVESVFQQSYTNWEIIVVNDAPEIDVAATLASHLSNPRIHLLQNDENRGVNFSRNRALDTVSRDSDYILFLDDDDYLTPGALETIATILKKEECNWLMTSRGIAATQATTRAPRNETYYKYAWDYLITKKITGDATHTIATKYIDGSKARVRFSTHIKQAEEWIFYFAISAYTEPYYTDVVTTLTEGYTPTGLNSGQKSTTTQLSRISLFIREGARYNLHKRASFWFYCGMRIIRAFIR